MLIPLEEVRRRQPRAAGFALLETGFRVFFALAGGYAVIAVLLWALAFFGVWAPPLGGLGLVQWHAHEMIYGFALAVIAGFLLTATGNWTGRRTLHGRPLAALALVWVAARVAFDLGFVVASGLFDMAFIAALSVAVLVPIVRARQKRQSGVLAKLALFLPAALLFTLGASGQWANGVNFGVTAGLYLVIGLILMMGRRVVPVFIRSGVPEAFEPRNSRILDVISLLTYLPFFVAMLLPTRHEPVAAGVIAVCASILFVANLLRLAGWHTPGIWRRPLVWVLYLGMAFVTLGFGLVAAAWLGWIPAYGATHAFAYGGIGLMTLGMMARVSLGHTGRSIHEPPAAIGVAFGVLAVGAVVRVVMPLVWPAGYPVWIGLSQALWVIAFGIFFVRYLPMLAFARVDGRPG